MKHCAALKLRLKNWKGIINSMGRNYIRALLVLGLFSISFSLAHAQETPEELQKAIQEKTNALQEVNQKIQQTQKDLQETADRSKSLQQEIKTIDKNIGSLNLSIKGSQLNIEKLNLEIKALQLDIGDTEATINKKKEAVGFLLQELQKKDNRTLLAILLQNQSLTDTLGEIQQFADFNEGLSSEVSELQALNDQLNGKLDTSADKKKKVELENSNLKYRRQIVEVQKNDRQTVLAQTKNQEKIYQSLITELEKQQNALEDEIQNIEEELKAKFDVSLTPIKKKILSWPVKLQNAGGVAYVTQHYGELSYLYRGKAHNGLDIGGLGIGSPVFAAADGIITAVDNNDRSTWNKYQYGKYVLIQHEGNLSTLYAHLSGQTVKKGAEVKRGDLIGYSGKTGYATGPHLHFGLYITSSIQLISKAPAAGLIPVGVILNPEDYLK